MVQVFLSHIIIDITAKSKTNNNIPELSQMLNDFGVVWYNFVYVKQFMRRIPSTLRGGYLTDLSC